MIARKHVVTVAAVAALLAAVPAPASASTHVKVVQSARTTDVQITQIVPPTKRKRGCFTDAALPFWKQGPVKIFRVRVEWRYCWNRPKRRVSNLKYFDVKPEITGAGKAIGWGEEEISSNPRGYFYRYRGARRGGYAKSQTRKFCQAVCRFAEVQARVSVRVNFTGKSSYDAD